MTAYEQEPEASHTSEATAERAALVALKTIHLLADAGTTWAKDATRCRIRTLAREAIAALAGASTGAGEARRDPMCLCGVPRSAHNENGCSLFEPECESPAAPLPSAGAAGDLDVAALIVEAKALQAKADDRAGDAWDEAQTCEGTGEKAVQQRAMRRYDHYATVDNIVGRLLAALDQQARDLQEERLTTLNWRLETSAEITALKAALAQAEAVITHAESGLANAVESGDWAMSDSLAAELAATLEDLRERNAAKPGTPR